MPIPTYEVILTHEHTDFDALASLFGASLLFPNARPILPYEINRKVSSFLVLYKNHFPFIQPRELQKGKIEHVILVDTDKANFPKGMQDETRFTVIDHHSFDQPFPDKWQVWNEAIGANTTLFVERLIEQGQHLSPVQATLLALGIHEDTGSLTYPSSTHRDAACLAWLMQPEHAINLKVIAQFLNHPLSDEQRDLLQTLIDQSEFLEVAGHSVVIAQADGATYSTELSTLAHRLVEFHEQDATFLVVDLGEMVQVVARSSTDAIDVGHIARALGGGGHTRAAAAPVNERTMQAVRDQIESLLHENTQPAVTVRQIMSVGTPKMVSPETTVQDAAELMRRYGHEGFPVVQQGATQQDSAEHDGNDAQQIVGILTRREIDRTLNHDLGTLPVSRIMQAGSVTVQPTDAITTLRKRMIDSRWGQIPVVDEREQIIGIVTRTDLIKLWDSTKSATERKTEIDQTLRRGLTPTQYALLRWIGAEADALHYETYIVGGYVRDLLLSDRLQNQQHSRHDQYAPASLDIDCVVEGDAILFAQRIQSTYGGRIIAHERFGTAKWLLTDAAHPVQIEPLRKAVGAQIVLDDLPDHLDFVSARTEFYTAPTVLPTVERSSIKLDLLRRDFSINTLAIALSQDRWGDLLDLFGGVYDLNHGIVKVLHSLSFVDDATRVLRAVRYEQRFGFQIEPRTRDLLHAALGMLDRVSPTRVWHELERVLQEAEPEKILLRLDQLGVLRVLHPKLGADATLGQRFERLRHALADADTKHLQHEPIDLLYWGAWIQDLPADVHEALAERLALETKTVKVMSNLRQFNQIRTALSQPALVPSEVVALLDPIDPLAIEIGLATNDLSAETHANIQRYLAEWQFVRAKLNGNDLTQLGIPRGPLYAKILGLLRNARLDGTIHNRDEEESLAKQIAANE